MQNKHIDFSNRKKKRIFIAALLLLTVGTAALCMIGFDRVSHYLLKENVRTVTITDTGKNDSSLASEIWLTVKQDGRTLSLDELLMKAEYTAWATNGSSLYCATPGGELTLTWDAPCDVEFEFARANSMGCASITYDEQTIHYDFYADSDIWQTYTVRAPWMKRISEYDLPRCLIALVLTVAVWAVAAAVILCAVQLYFKLPLWLDKNGRRYKLCITWSALLSALILGGIALVTYVVDPFFQYRDPFGAEPYEDGELFVFQNATYQNPGMVKNFDYELLIAGSSMTQNFDTNYFEKLFGQRTLKASLAGSNLKNSTAMAQLAASHNENLKKVFISLDDYCLYAAIDEEGNQPTAYLMNDNPFDDVSYLLNKTVLFDYTLTDLSLRAEGNVSNPPKSHLFQWWGGVYGPTVVLPSPRDSENNAEEEIKNALSKDAYFKAAEANLNTYLLPLITAYPDVEFVFFLPPYSMIYWEGEMKVGHRDAIIEMYRYALKQLLQYENVRVFDFQTIEPLVSNLWNYKDSQHYNWRVNSYMTECFASGAHEVTADTVDEVMEQQYRLTSDFDYEIYYQDDLRFVSDINDYLSALETGGYVQIVTIAPAELANLPEQIRAHFASLDALEPKDGDKFYVLGIDGQDLQTAVLTDGSKTVELQLGGRGWTIANIQDSGADLLSVSMEGVEYSQDLPSLSFVVYDAGSRQVVDSVAFEGETLTANRLHIWSDLLPYREAIRWPLLVD